MIGDVGSQVIIPVSKLALVGVLMLIVSPAFAAAAQQPKIVYVAINIDTEMWGGHDQYLTPPLSSDPHPKLDMRAYARSPPSTASQVFDEHFRKSHKDSFGEKFKMTWFAEMDYLTAEGIYVYADGAPAGVSGYTAIRDILIKNWGKEITKYGDSIEYHHHFMIYDGTWQTYDAGPDDGYPDYQNHALDHMMLDKKFFPSSWRSGWLIMPPALSNWLEEWMPFDFTPETGSYPDHPPGMDRWQTGSSACGDPDRIQESFQYATDHGTAIYACFMHDRDDMAGMIDDIQTALEEADADQTAYPNVSFKYVSARGAMQGALGFTDFHAPKFTVKWRDGTYTIESKEPIWNNSPYLALLYGDGTYMNVEATSAGTNTWTVTPASSLTISENVALRASAVTAQSYDDPYRPELAIDGVESRYHTNYWGTSDLVPEGRVPQWLKLDLGSPVTISKITTHFYDGDTRTYTYYIEISNDGSSWTRIVRSKTGIGSVTDTFPEVAARYVRITIEANTANLAAHIEEIKVYHVTLIPLVKMGVAASDLYGNPGVYVFRAKQTKSSGIMQLSGGIYETTQNLLNELITLRTGVTDKETGRKLDEAIEHLTKALFPEVWEDQDHLDSKHGDKAFNELKDAVAKLVKLTKDKKSTISATVLDDFVRRLVDMSGLLASTAIDDAANAPNGDQRKIDQSNEELVKAKAASADGKFAESIEHYKKAWKYAQEAVK